MEIKDFIRLWTYSQWRQAIVVIPPFSPERERGCMLSFSWLSYSYVFVKWKKCNILPSFLLIHIVGSTFPHQPKAGGPPFLSRTGNVSHASIHQLSHSYSLQEENIPLHTVPNSIGICRPQTKFATFTLSLQNGKSSLFRSFMQLWNSYFYTRH